MKQKLVESHSERVRRIESGEQVIVGVNKFTESEPLTAGRRARASWSSEAPPSASRSSGSNAWRDARDGAAVDRRWPNCGPPRRRGATSCPPSIACAKAGVTTGEWGGALREVFGEYRAPTGVSAASMPPRGNIAEVRAQVEAVSQRLGRRLKLLVGKPGLDGHSNGAEQIACARATRAWRWSTRASA